MHKPCCVPHALTRLHTLLARHLGALRAAVPTLFTALRRLLLEEAVARTLRKLVRDAWRSERAEDGGGAAPCTRSALHGTAVRLLNLACGNDVVAGASFWTATLLPQVEQRFPSVTLGTPPSHSSDGSNKQHPALHLGGTGVRRVAVLMRTLDLCGMGLRPALRSALEAFVANVDESSDEAAARVNADVKLGDGSTPVSGPTESSTAHSREQVTNIDGAVIAASATPLLQSDVSHPTATSKHNHALHSATGLCLLHIAQQNASAPAYQRALLLQDASAALRQGLRCIPTGTRCLIGLAAAAFGLATLSAFGEKTKQEATEPAAALGVEDSSIALTSRSRLTAATSQQGRGASSPQPDGGGPRLRVWEVEQSRPDPAMLLEARALLEHACASMGLTAHPTAPPHHAARLGEVGSASDDDPKAWTVNPGGSGDNGDATAMSDVARAATPQPVWQHLAARVLLGNTLFQLGALDATSTAQTEALFARYAELECGAMHVCFHL